MDTGQAPKGWRIKFTEWRGRDIEADQQTEFFDVFRRFADKAERSEPSARAASPEILHDWNRESDDES